MHQELARRRHPRVEANFLVLVRGRGVPLVHKAKNVSLNGILLSGDGVERGAPVVVEMPLPEESRMISATGRVVRHGPDEAVGIHFTDLDWDGILAMARFLAPRLP